MEPRGWGERTMAGQGKGERGQGSDIDTSRVNCDIAMNYYKYITICCQDNPVDTCACCRVLDSKVVFHNLSPPFKDRLNMSILWKLCVFFCRPRRKSSIYMTERIPGFERYHLTNASKLMRASVGCVMSHLSGIAQNMWCATLLQQL